MNNPTLNLFIGAAIVALSIIAAAYVNARWYPEGERQWFCLVDERSGKVQCAFEKSAE